jgi:hypothetical protein
MTKGSRYEGNEIYFRSQLSTLMEKKNRIFLTWWYSPNPLARLCAEVGATLALFRSLYQDMLDRIKLALG